MGITLTFWKIWVFIILLHYDHTRAETLTMCQGGEYSGSPARHIARIITSDGPGAFYNLHDEGAFDIDGGCTSFEYFDTTGNFISIDIQQCPPQNGLAIINITYGSVIINSFSGDCVAIDGSVKIEVIDGSQDPTNLCESINIASGGPNVNPGGNVVSNVADCGNAICAFVDPIFNTSCADALLSSAPTTQTGSHAPSIQTNAPSNSPTQDDDDDDDDSGSSGSSGSGSEEYAFSGLNNEMNLDENDNDGTVHMVLKFSDNVWMNLWCLFGAIFIYILACLYFCYKKNQH